MVLKTGIAKHCIGCSGHRGSIQKTAYTAGAVAWLLWLPCGVAVVLDFSDNVLCSTVSHEIRMSEDVVVLWQPEQPESRVDWWWHFTMLLFNIVFNHACNFCPDLRWNTDLRLLEICGPCRVSCSALQTKPPEALQATADVADAGMYSADCWAHSASVTYQTRTLLVCCRKPFDLCEICDLLLFLLMTVAWHQCSSKVAEFMNYFCN